MCLRSVGILLVSRICPVDEGRKAIQPPHTTLDAHIVHHKLLPTHSEIVLMRCITPCPAHAAPSGEQAGHAAVAQLARQLTGT